jgi:glycolate oxidase iron-sulfur subunit
MRRGIATLFPRSGVFNVMTRAGMAMRPLVPSALAGKLPREIPAAGQWPAPRHARRMIALAGCVQPALTPDTNAAAARVLDRLGISLVEAPGGGCCGALRFHLNFQDAGLDDMRRMIDAWWPLVESGAEAIVMTASGCGSTVREYGHHLAHDPRYAAKAARVSAITRDLSEVLAAELDRLVALARAGAPRRVAFHAPCTLQHWQRLKGVTEGVLAKLGYELVPVPDAHMCCGAAVSGRTRSLRCSPGCRTRSSRPTSAARRISHPPRPCRCATGSSIWRRHSARDRKTSFQIRQ